MFESLLINLTLWSEKNIMTNETWKFGIQVQNSKFVIQTYKDVKLKKERDVIYQLSWKSHNQVYT